MLQFLSIDFEDIAHDFKRDLGLWDTGPLRTDALWRIYYEIDDFIQNNGRDENVRGTFFCTGVIADQAPDLIHRIARDGHEIGCHYHFHDEMRNQDATLVEQMLARAKDALEAASGTKVVGFRAPKFKIDKSEPAQYQAVQKHFLYDSSFPAGSLEDVRKFKKRMGLNMLRILPIYQGKVSGITMKMGGSYFKMFPRAMSKRLVTDAKSAGFVPHIYLHPHEFARHGQFKLTRSDRKPLGVGKATYWGLRQIQWHSIGNRALPTKLSALVDAAGLQGRLIDHLDLLGI